MKDFGKSKITIVVIISIIIITFISVSVINIISQREIEREELSMRRIELSDQLFYARDMFFESNMPGDLSSDFNWAGINVRGGNVLAFMDQEVSDVVFVHSEAEAIGFADDVIVGWPSEYSKMFLERLNGNANINAAGEGIDINLPLTPEDMVDNWELVNEVWTRFDSSVGRVLRNSISNERIMEQDIDEVTEEELTEE